MRRLLAVTVIAGLMALAACTPAAPAGGDPSGAAPSSPRPVTVAPSSTPSASAKPTKSPSASAQATADESEEEQGDDASEPTVSFKKAYTYPDGVRVEVSNVEHGKRKGTPWVQVSIRVTNGSKRRLSDPIGSFTLAFDGDEADPVRVPGLHDTDLTGHISRGKSKICSSTFSIPLKSQDHVFLEFTADIDHGSILFSGSIA